MSHIDDIRNWRTGLPIASHWNTGTHTPDWHVAQIKAGARMVPTIKLEILTQLSRDKVTGAYLGAVPKMSDESRLYMQQNRLPICLRTDNIGSIAVQWPRPAKSIENLPLSAVPWGILPDGTIDDKGVPDYFAEPSLWRQFGALWGSCKYVRDVQAMFPDVPFWILADNNEINQTVANYLSDVLDASGKSIIDQYGNSLKKYRDGMEALSIRFAEYTKSHPVEEFIREFYFRKVSLYESLLSAFDDGLSAWKGKMLTECYSGIQSNGTGGDISWTPWYSHCRAMFDGGGPPAYVKIDSGLWNHTSPEWFRFANIIPAFEQAERLSRNMNEFREVFVTITPNAAIKAKIAGIHEAITPVLHGASVEWLLWSLKGYRVPFMVRYWTSNGDKPTDIILDSYTKQDYFDACVKTVNRICENPTLREFWLNGFPVITGKHPSSEIRTSLNSVPPAYPRPGEADNRWRLLDVDLNTPRSDWVLAPTGNGRGGYNQKLSIKVWATAIEMGGRYLVFMWTPCALTGSCTFSIPNVGSFTVPVPQPSGYYIVEKTRWEARPL